MQDAMAALPAEVLIQVLARPVAQYTAACCCQPAVWHAECVSRPGTEGGTEGAECWIAYEWAYTKLELSLAWVAPVCACLGSPCRS